MAQAKQYGSGADAMISVDQGADLFVESMLSNNVEYCSSTQERTLSRSRRAWLSTSIAAKTYLKPFSVWTKRWGWPPPTVIS